MDVGLSLKVDKFNAAMRGMHAALNRSVPMRTIIDFEVSRILAKSLSSTDTATAESINKSQSSRKWITIDGKPTFINHRGAAIAQRAKAALRLSTQRKIAARGLAKRSWHALGQQLGFDIEAPGYVKRAAVADHTSAENVGIRRAETPTNYGLTISNKSPMLRWAEGRQAFFAAVSGRISTYKRSVRDGVFNDLAKVAAKYPGLKVTPRL